MRNDSHDTGRNMNMWSDPSKNIIQLALVTFFFFFKRILLRSNSVSGFQKFIYCLPRTQSENIKHDTKWRLYGIRKSCSEYYSWQIYFKVTKSNQAWPFLYNFYTILSYILLLFFFSSIRITTKKLVINNFYISKIETEDIDLIFFQFCENSSE